MSANGEQTLTRRTTRRRSSMAIADQEKQNGDRRPSLPGPSSSTTVFRPWASHDDSDSSPEVSPSVASSSSAMENLQILCERTFSRQTTSSSSSPSPEASSLPPPTQPPHAFLPSAQPFLRFATPPIFPPTSEAVAASLNGLNIDALPRDVATLHRLDLLSSADVQRIHAKRQRPKKFICPDCNAAFSNNGQLKGHIRTHTGKCFT